MQEARIGIEIFANQEHRVRTDNFIKLKAKRNPYSVIAVVVAASTVAAYWLR